MNLLSRIFGSPTVFQMRAVALPPMTELHPRELYKLLDAYYLNNGLYDYLAQVMYESAIWKESLKSLRNPAKRVVEFHVAHLWPGMLPDALPIKSDNKKIVEPIKQIWRWSNWSANKQLAVRMTAKFGDLFIKTVRTESQVYLQLIDPQYVTDFDTDHRDFITYIRLDFPQQRREKDKIENFTLTEVWNKTENSFRVWEHDEGIGAGLTRLGTPVKTMEIGEFGIDFVPFVHGKFMDIGDDRGAGAFVLELDKIDEVNRKATRLAQMIFRYNKALWALEANAVDKSGRPLPPPRIAGESGGDTSSDTIELGDDRLIRLPGQSKLASLVPEIDYNAHLEALKADLEDLEQDLPEITYYRLRDTGNLSGRALQLLLAPAIAKALEARGNLETALARADAMALTLASKAGLKGFTEIGNFEMGDFEHQFAERDVIPISEQERAEEGKTYVEMKVPLKTVLRRLGWTEADLKQMGKDKEEEQRKEKTTLAEAVLRAQRAMAAGEASNGLEQGDSIATGNGEE